MPIHVPRPDMPAIIKKSGKSPEEVATFIAMVERSMEPLQKRIAVTDGDDQRYYSVVRLGLGVLLTLHGKFWQYSFRIDDQWENYSVLVKAEINTKTLNPVFKRHDRLLVRTDSGCETGQIFGDLTCDCCQQLHLAMKTITEVGEGLIVNIPRQDGRGMGLTFKLGTLWLQDELKINTVESAGLLAPDGIIDIRTYSGVIAILQFFGVMPNTIIDLATNNPYKLEIFNDNGYTVADELIPISVAATEHTAHHFEAKAKHLGHDGLNGHGKGSKS